MHTHLRGTSAPSLVAFLALALLPAAACGGGGPAPQVNPPDDTAGDEAEVGPSACEGQVLMTTASPELPALTDPLECEELSPPPLVPLPTSASCRSLSADERSVCSARVRARARAARLLAEARAAMAASSWPEAIAKLEAAVVIVVDEPDVLAELGWARFRAHEWCAATQDLDALQAAEDSLDEGDEPSPILALCTQQVSLHQALDELGVALNAAPSQEQRAAWEHQRAQVSAALGQTDDALEAERRSLCARDDAEVREALAVLLTGLAHRDGPSAPDEAIRLYREAHALAPTPEREAFVRDVLLARQQRFAFEAAPPVEPAELFPSVEALCQALVLRDLSEPVDPSELPDDLCDVSDWDDVGLARGDEQEVLFRVAVLAVRNPELYDGPVQANYLVARSSRGVNVLLYLGQDHGDSRNHNAFVGSVASSFLWDLPDAPLVVTWDAGEAEAYDCDWRSRASTTAAVCALLDGTPRCYAVADLGPAEYTSDTMLATVQESLGNCEEVASDAPPREPRDFRPRFTLDVSAQELAVTREGDGAMLCLPPGDTLSPLRQPTAGR